MDFDASPLVGSWYRRLDRPQPFRVVAFDRDAGSIDIEYFDGTLDEWPLDHWRALDIEPCETPQDWTGPFDSVDGGEAPEDETTLAVDAVIEPLEAAQDEADRRLMEAQAADISSARASNPRPPASHRKPPGRMKR